MSKQLYKPGDMVVANIMFSDETVIITKAEQIGEIWCYEFVIPERRGSVPQHLISSRVAYGMKVPVWRPQDWVQL